MFCFNFQVWTNNKSKIDINPYEGVMLPHSTVVVGVSTWINFQSDLGIHNFNPYEGVSLHMECPDELIIISLVVPPEFTVKDITENTVSYL